MCGRYYAGDKDEEAAFTRIVTEANDSKALFHTPVMKHTGEILPGDPAPVIISGSGIGMRWGYRLDRRLVINARGETLDTTAMFRSGLRCVVPAFGYFEWDSIGNRYLFRSRHENALLLMAGIWHICDDGKAEFAVVTTDAVGPCAAIHPRMPVLLDSPEPWLEGRAYRKCMTGSLPVCLPYGPTQLTMF